MLRPLQLLMLMVLATHTTAATVAKASQHDAPLFRKLSNEDVFIADATLQRALEDAVSNNTVSWRNVQSGHAGSVTPVRTFRTKGGFYCRDYIEVITVGPGSEVYRDRACRDPNGVWLPIKLE